MKTHIIMKGIRLILFATALVLTVVCAGCKKDVDNWPDCIKIRTAVDLDAVRNNLSGKYVLMNDISLADYNVGEGWAPIGIQGTPFTGIFNGNGHKVTGLAINRSAEQYVGLFGCIDDGSVSTLGVEIAAGGVNGRDYTGGIAGVVIGGSTIANCYTAGNIYSSYGDSGGITGGIAGGSAITNCYTAGNISSYSSSGGIAGGISSSTITNCYSTGNITSSGSFSCSGGITGFVNTSMVYGDGAITGCAAINPIIDAEAGAGRICTILNPLTITNNFALDVMFTTGPAKFDITDPMRYGISKTKAQLQMQSTYSDAPVGDGQGGLGWKFGNDDENPWKMPAGGGYPILYWQ